jgi:hypothetical protein
MRVFDKLCQNLSLSRAIVADTDPPRVRPRKSTKQASLRPVDALSLRHHAARRDTGDTMYRSLLEADAALALTLAFAAVLFVVGTLARGLRQLTSAEQNNKSNAHRSSAETI